MRPASIAEVLIVAVRALAVSAGTGSVSDLASDPSSSLVKDDALTEVRFPSSLCDRSSMKNVTNMPAMTIATVVASYSSSPRHSLLKKISA